MRQFILAGAVMILATQVAAQSAEQRETECRLQGELAGAVQQARLDRVRQARVIETLRAENPDWPASADRAIAPLVDFIYSVRRRDLQGVDLEAQTYQTCLQNYDQIQQLKNQVTN